MRRWQRNLAVALGGGTVIGLLIFARRYFDRLADGSAQSPWPMLLDELTAAWLAALLIMIVVIAALRFPIRDHWPAFALGSPIFAALHTLGMFISRSALYPLVGLGPYNYGDLGFRFLMEAPIQLLAYVIALFDVTFYRRTLKAREAQRLEALLNEAQLERLRLTIAPHFLFNTLNVISAAAYESPQKADHLIDRLARLLRALISTDARQTCTLGDELSVLDEYLALQKARFEDDLEISIDCPQELQRCEVPFMILQPLVENALQHGRDEDGRVRLEIRAREDGDNVRIEIVDRGPGPDSPTDGVGTRNTRERIAHIYGDPYGFELLGGRDGGAIARLTLPRRCES